MQRAGGKWAIEIYNFSQYIETRKKQGYKTILNIHLTCLCECC